MDRKVKLTSRHYLINITFVLYQKKRLKCDFYSTTGQLNSANLQCQQVYLKIYRSIPFELLWAFSNIHPSHNLSLYPYFSHTDNW